MKMLAGYIAYRVKKKNLSTDFKYGEPTKELVIQNKDWLTNTFERILNRTNN